MKPKEIFSPNSFHHLCWSILVSYHSTFFNSVDHSLIRRFLERFQVLDKENDVNEYEKSVFVMRCKTKDNQLWGFA